MVLTFIYQFGVSKGGSKAFWVIPAYFFAVLVLSALSMHFFPLSGDEILYHNCGNAFSQLFSEGIFSQLPSSDNCQVGVKNFFVHFTGYLYWIGGRSFFSLIGWNAFAMYMASDLCLRSFEIPEEKRRRLFQIFIFFPPLLYLTLRPAKEATIALLIAASFFAIAQGKGRLQILYSFFVLLFFYLVRWQYAGLFLLAILLLIIWEGFVRFSNKVKLVILVTVMAVLFQTWMTVKDQALEYLFINHFNPNVVLQEKSNPGGALIYKIMVYESGGAKALQPWNILVAFAGGFLTPHPLRFIKEYMRDGIFDYNVFEEFLFLSLWFYLLLPIFGFYLYRTYLLKIRNLRKVSRSDVFKLIFVSLLFSVSCMTLFMETPQMFRYKIPLNIYVFGSIAVYIYLSGVGATAKELKDSRFLIAGYILFLMSYSLVYLFPGII